MKKKIQFRNAYWLILSFFCVLFDQMSKYLVLHCLSQKELKISSFLNFRLAINPGIAFGSFSNWPLSKFWLLLAIFLSLLFIYYLMITQSKFISLLFGLALIIGGAVANFIDRIFHGAVIDFIDFHVKNWHFYTFNLADSFISIGGIFLFYAICFRKQHW